MIWYVALVFILENDRSIPYFAQVTQYGWTSYLRANRRHSFSLSKAQAHWTPQMRVRYDAQADRSWSRSRFVARPLSAPWRGKLQPAMAISSSRLIVAAGSNIYSYRFDIPATADDAPPIQFEGVCNLSEPGQPRRDVTAVAFIPDGGLDLTIYVGFQDGVLERLTIHPSKYPYIPIMTERCIIEGDLKQHDLVESFSSDGSHLLALSSNGVASLSDNSSPSLPPTLLNLQTRSWTTHLSMQASTPYAAFGTSSATPLKIHYITSDAFSATPSAILYANNGHFTHNSLHSAVYGIANGPPSSPWGSSPQIIVSGWYDGFVRVHDLRSSSRTFPSGHQDPAPLLPVLSMCDPLSYEPIYDVSCGGGSASHVAAGSARHSVVSFWDVRSPTLGWSVHAPGNDLSPGMFLRHNKFIILYPLILFSSL